MGGRGERDGEEGGQRSIKDLHVATHSPQWLVISWHCRPNSSGHAS